MIIQLGGTPVMQFYKLIAPSKCGFNDPPSDSANLKQVKQNVLDAEHVL
jgi:hypothetical protein